MNQRIVFMRLYRCEKIFRLITEWIFKILIDSMKHSAIMQNIFHKSYIFLFF